VRSLATRRGLERALETLLARETDLGSERLRRLASAMSAVAQWFADEICLRRCRRECLMAPEADGRDLFYAPGHPAGLDVAGRPAGEGAPSPVAAPPWRHLERRFDETIRSTAAAVDALAALGFVPRGGDRAAYRRLLDTAARLRAARRELAALGDDAASIYSYVDEAHTLESELHALERQLAVVALRATPPRREQFAAFRPYPAATLAARRFARELARLGLHEVEVASVQAALDRLDSPAPVLALLRGAARPGSTRQARAIAERLTDLSDHTPRTRLDSRTPSQASSEA
jgi:hypothetical protein